MKKNLIKTLLIGATIGTALTGLASNRADACRLTRYETLAETTCHDRVELHIENGEYYKRYKSLDYCYYFYDYHELDCNSGPLRLYCADAYGNRVNGLIRNGNKCYYFIDSKAITGERWIDGHLWSFDSETYQGKMIR